MSLKAQIDQDLKSAMLGGDKVLATTLRGLKSAILNAEIETGKRDQGLDDQEVIVILRKEAKKRQESADLFKRGGNAEKSQAETQEIQVINKYLPAMMSESDVAKEVEAAIDATGAVSIQDMGKVIGSVKSKLGGSADGALIARITKEKLQ